MTPHQVHLVKTTWQAAAQDAEAVGKAFYNKLFEIAPEVKHLFERITVEEQSKKLLNMISYVISKLDRLEDIIDEVAKLAQRHAGYGVESYHYDHVGNALLWTLEKGLKDQWTAEVESAWILCYTILSTAMINASVRVNDAA